MSGIYISGSGDNQGLFGVIDVGTVQNVGVVDSYIKSGADYVVGVVGNSSNSAVQSCYNTGSVSGINGVGGVVGGNDSSTVQNCYNTGSVIGDEYVGGVVEWNDSSTVQNCYNIGSVIGGGTYVGGVVGANKSSTVKNCYNTGSVIGDEYVGGVLGRNESGTVKNSYNSGSVSGSNGVGGVVGGIESDTVQNCYNTGSVIGDKYVGGVVGWGSTDMVTGCYYDKQMCTCTYGIGNSSSSTNGEDKLTSEMATATVFTGWDTDVWNFTEGLYPSLDGMDTTNAAYVSVAPVFLTGGENISELTVNFTVSTANSVSWSSSNSGVISISGGSATIESSGTDVVLTATLGDYSKTVTISSVILPSSDVGLTTVLSKAIIAGGEGTTTGAPKTASISVSNLVARVESSDIVVATNATATFYGADSAFYTLENGSVPLTVDSATTVYIKVVAEDGLTTVYYAVSITPEEDYIATDTMTNLYDTVVTNSGAAPTSGYYSISSKAELEYLEAYTNLGKNTIGVTFYLTDNIVLNNNASDYESWSTIAPANSWTPI